MRITRRESLHRLIRLAAMAPLGMAAACMAEPGESVDEAEHALAMADDEAEALAEADVVVEIDEETAKQHFAAMERCLREHGIEKPPGGPFRIRLPEPPPGAEGRRKRFIFRAVGPGEPERAKLEAVALDDRTREAMRACAAQVGLPGSAAR